LHTPTAKANQMAPSMATRDSGSWGLGLYPTPTTNGLDGGSNSRKAAKVRGMWPTPTASEGTGPQENTGRTGGKSLREMVADPKTTGSLNPMWVAWLMGYPTEYLSCVHWETRSFRKSRNN
jgi:hypothetical protein